MIAWPATVIGNTRGNAVWWEGLCESSFRYLRDTLLAGGKLLSQKPKKPKRTTKRMSDFAEEGFFQFDTASVETQVCCHSKEK